MLQPAKQRLMLQVQKQDVKIRLEALQNKTNPCILLGTQSCLCLVMVFRSADLVCLFCFSFQVNFFLNSQKSLVFAFPFCLIAALIITIVAVLCTLRLESASLGKTEGETVSPFRLPATSGIRTCGECQQRQQRPDDAVTAPCAGTAWLLLCLYCSP